MTGVVMVAIGAALIVSARTPFDVVGFVCAFGGAASLAVDLWRTR